MLSFRVLASRITTPDTKLFAIRLGVSKATSMDIKHIILITDSLGTTRKIANYYLLVHSEQAHSLTICSALKLFFYGGLSYKIKF